MTTAILKQTGCDALPRTLMRYAAEHSLQEEERGRETPKAFANPLKDPLQGPSHCARDVNNWGRMAVQSHSETFGWYESPTVLFVTLVSGPVMLRRCWSVPILGPPQPLALKIV